MSGRVNKLIRKKVMQGLNKERGLGGKAKLKIFKRGVRETSKHYNTLNKPAPPKIVRLKKQHDGESLKDLKDRRKACNARRREREKAYGIAEMSHL